MRIILNFLSHFKNIKNHIVERVARIGKMLRKFWRGGPKEIM
jgi:hypothetical protein